jgi:molybdate transport system ATP-binding protein
LDLESATAIRALLADVLLDTTALIATHAALDAHALARSVVVLDHGRIAEHGPTTRVLTKPHTPFAARMAGRVLLTGMPEVGGIRLASGELVACETEAVAEGARAAVAVHPRDVRLDTVGIADVVTALEPHGDLVRVHGDRLAADVDPLAQPLPRPGEEVHFAVVRSPSAYSV